MLGISGHAGQGLDPTQLLMLKQYTGYRYLGPFSRRSSSVPEGQDARDYSRYILRNSLLRAWLERASSADLRADYGNKRHDSVASRPYVLQRSSTQKADKPLPPIQPVPAAGRFPRRNDLSSKLLKVNFKYKVVSVLWSREKAYLALPRIHHYDGVMFFLIVSMALKVDRDS